MFDKLKEMAVKNGLWEESNQPQTEVKQTLVVNQAVVAAPVNYVPPAQMVSAAIDPKFLQHFSDLFDKSNMEGADFYEFRKALDQQVSLPLPENQKYAMVFGSLAIVGLTKTKLIDSSNYYLSIFAKEKESFEGKIAAKKESEIGARQTKITGEETSIKEKTELIQKLSMEIQQHQQNIGSLQMEIQQKTQEINQTENNFNLSYQSVYQGIIDDQTKINNYIVEIPKA